MLLDEAAVVPTPPDVPAMEADDAIVIKKERQLCLAFFRYRTLTLISLPPNSLSIFVSQLHLLFLSRFKDPPLSYLQTAEIALQYSFHHRKASVSLVSQQQITRYVCMNLDIHVVKNINFRVIFFLSR